jgi:hypothetical protein
MVSNEEWIAQLRDILSGTDKDLICHTWRFKVFTQGVFREALHGMTDGNLKKVGSIIFDVLPEAERSQMIEYLLTQAFNPVHSETWLGSLAGKLMGLIPRSEDNAATVVEKISKLRFEDLVIREFSPARKAAISGITGAEIDAFVRQWKGPLPVCSYCHYWSRLTLSCRTRYGD